MVPTRTGPSRPPPPPRPGPVYSPFAGHTVGGGKHGRIWPWKWHPLAFDWFLGPKPWKGKVGRQGTLRSPWWEKPHRRIGSNFHPPPPHFVVHGTRVPCARTRTRSISLTPGARQRYPVVGHVRPDMRACGAEFPWDKDEPLSTSGIRTWMYKAPRQQLRQTTGPAQAHDSPAHTSSTQPSRTPPKTPRLAARRGPEVQARHPGHADTGGMNPPRRRADGGLGRRRRGRRGHHKWLAWAHSWGFPSEPPSPPPATQSPQYVLDSAAL